MNRVLTTLVAVSLTAGIFAQSAFTIRRPTNGSLVRETVKVRIPRNSIPEGGYVAFNINGKFVEAAAPMGKENVVDGMWIYDIDTKEKEIADGNLKIEAILYGPFGSSYRAVNRSSVTVKLDNRASIRPPAGGFKLRYRFTQGSELIYTIKRRQGINQLSEAQAQLGGRAAELSQDIDSLRYLVGIDKSYNGGAEALLRFQAMPENGKPYVYVMAGGETERKKYDRPQLHPVYMKMTNTGREIFGRAPVYMGLEGVSGREATTDLFATIPLPVLPTAGVQLGRPWQSGIAAYAVEDLSKIYGTRKLTEPQPARCVLEAIEYQNGERCAKIRNTLAVGTKAGPVTNEQEEIFWFSLDRGVMLRMERNYIRTDRVRTAPSGGGQGGGSSSGAATRPGRGGRPGGGGGADAAPGSEGIFQNGPESPESLRQDRGGKGGGGGRTNRQDGGGGPANRGGGGNAGGSRGGTQIIKTRVQIIMTLDAVL